MENNRLLKYNELTVEYFSSSIKWTYEWRFLNDECCLDWDEKNGVYMYWKNKKLICSYKDIYEAIDDIKVGDKTVRQALLETDFDFESIL